MGQGNLGFDILAAWCGERCNRLTIHADGNIGWVCIRGCFACILDTENQFLRFATQAKARHADEADAAVKLIACTGNQPVNGGFEIQFICFGRHIMHLTIGNHNRAANT